MHALYVQEGQAQYWKEPVAFKLIQFEYNSSQIYKKKSDSEER